MLLIPLALYVVPWMAGGRLDPHQVSGLVLVQSVASALGGGFGHSRHGHVDERLLWTYGPLLALGGVAGALGSALLPGRALLLIFAIVTTGAAVLMLFRPRAVPEIRHRHRILAGAILFVIALLGGAIGVGASFLTIPAMLYLLGVDGRVASGTALAMSIFLVGPALLGKVVTGQIIYEPAIFIAVAAAIGSRLGAHLSRHVPVARMRLGLAGLIGLLAMRVWADLL